MNQFKIQNKKIYGAWVEEKGDKVDKVEFPPLLPCSSASHSYALPI